MKPKYKDTNVNSAVSAWSKSRKIERSCLHFY